MLQETNQCIEKFVLYHSIARLAFCSLIFWTLYLFNSRGYGDQEIEAAFAKYDVDGDQVLDEEEQRKMQDDLERQRVNFNVSQFFLHFLLVFTFLQYTDWGLLDVYVSTT